MSLLFHHYACDVCDGIVPPTTTIGFILRQKRHYDRAVHGSIFRRRRDAVHFLRMMKNNGNNSIYDILPCETDAEVEWMEDGGIEYTNSVFTIYPTYVDERGDDIAWVVN